ncbi:MAG TPA: outer membrane protein assembly factor BamD [Candidatus Saccharimonadales bacterium]|nr:outer membrane protein assembly factor BamD [Candidatus Saccharimonadales bacterium]
MTRLDGVGTVAVMFRRFLPLLMTALLLFGSAVRCPAPLIFTPGEGWRYEKVGSEGSWVRTRAKDQLEVAERAFDEEDFSLAIKAARRTVNVWPFSDYAPRGQYLLGRCYEAKKQDEAAFKAYQKLIERYPKISNYGEIILRQMAIANRFLAGQWFRAFNYIPLFPSMDKTIKLYDQIIKNGPYSEVSPQAQINIGNAHENKFVSDYAEAARAYERAADRYSDRKEGTDGLYRAGDTYFKQAKKAEYDQSVAAQSIATFTDFTTLHPEDKRVTEAQKKMEQLKTEQSRGSFDIARYYERHGKWEAAKIYYNDARAKDPNSKYAEEALQRIDAITKHHPKP